MRVSGRSSVLRYSVIENQYVLNENGQVGENRVLYIIEKYYICFPKLSDAYYVIDWFYDQRSISAGQII